MKRKAGTLFILVGVFAMGCALHAADPLQDSQFEKRIHGMFTNKALDPVSDEEWSAFLDRVDSETYTVRKGDTLWGLSQAFFGDGLYWPKIWSLNDRITNPHLIYPSAEVRFFSGTSEKPPGIQVVGSESPEDNLEAAESGPQPEAPEGEESPESAVEGGTVSGVQYEPVMGLYPGAPQLPPSRTNVAPVSGIPPAFERSSFSIEKYDESGVSFDLRPPPPLASNLLAHTFFYEGRVRDYPSVGEIIELEDGQESTGFGSILYVETDEETAVGQVFTVISKDFSQRVNGIRGTVFRYAGQVKILAALGSTRYRAVVISALFPVLKGAILTNEKIPSFDDGIQVTNSDSFEIQGGAYNKRRDLFGEGSVVFLNGGQQNNVKVGQVFGVYKNRTVRYRDAQVKKSPLPIAAIKVFRIDESSASGMIISASEPVWVRDTTGPLKVGSLNISSDEREDIDSLEAELDEDSSGEEGVGETLSEEDITDFPESEGEDEDFGEDFGEDENLEDDEFEEDDLEEGTDEELLDSEEDDLDVVEAEGFQEDSDVFDEEDSGEGDGDFDEPDFEEDSEDLDDDF